MTTRRKQPVFKPFDLVELTTPIDGHQPGERATVTIEGIGQCMVDFEWPDGHRPDHHDVVHVPFEALKLVERRPGFVPGKPHNDG
jgi:hypothetical protein